MAKLYAEITSDKGGRVASKGGEDYVMVALSEKNVRLFEITFKTTEHHAYIDIITLSDGKIRHVHCIDNNPF